MELGMCDRMKQLLTKWSKLQREGGTIRCTRTGKVYIIVPANEWEPNE